MDRCLAIEPKWLFRLRLSVCLMRWAGYARNPAAAWRYSGDASWLKYWRDGYTGRQAWQEDYSYAD